MASVAAPRAATAAQVAAWKKRMGYSIAEAAAELDVHPRTFCRWMAGHAESSKYLGERFRTEGAKR